MNKLLKYLFFVLLVFGIQHKTSAQPGGSLPFRENNRAPFRQNNRPRFNGNKLDAVKNAFINKQLNLTPEEADRFWPVYYQYQGELNDILRQRRLNNSNPQPNGIDQVDKDLYYEQKLLALRKRYKDEFLRVLPAEKVSLLYKSEREFKDELIRQLRERGNNPQK